MHTDLGWIVMKLLRRYVVSWVAPVDRKHMKAIQKSRLGLYGLMEQTRVSPTDDTSWESAIDEHPETEPHWWHKSDRCVQCNDGNVVHLNL
jgi:hypothetical protein